MTDDDRKDLYAALLRGMGDIAQDRLCEADQNHAWSPWARRVVSGDGDSILLPYGVEPVDRAIQTYSVRRCLNCGKEERSAG